jgi:hypothetical protein
VSPTEGLKGPATTLVTPAALARVAATLAAACAPLRKSEPPIARRLLCELLNIHCSALLKANAAGLAASRRGADAAWHAFQARYSQILEKQALSVTLDVDTRAVVLWVAQELLDRLPSLEPDGGGADAAASGDAAVPPASGARRSDDGGERADGTREDGPGGAADAGSGGGRPGGGAPTAANGGGAEVAWRRVCPARSDDLSWALRADAAAEAMRAVVPVAKVRPGPSLTA